MNNIVTATLLPDHDNDGSVTLVYDGPVLGGHRYWIDGQPRYVINPPAQWSFGVDPLVVITGNTRQVSAPISALSGRVMSGMGLYAKNASSAGVVNGLVIGDVDGPSATGIYRQQGTATSHLTNMLMERVRITAGRYGAGVARGLFLGSGRIDNLTIRKCSYEGVEPITNPGDIYPGIGLTGKDGLNRGAGFLFEDLDLRGFRTNYADPNAYKNNDGIAVERGYTDGLIRRAYIADADDGGIDMKGERWRMKHVTVENCSKSFRFWSSGVDGPIASINPAVAHIMMMGDATAGSPVRERVIEHIKVRGAPTVPIARFEDAGSVVRILSWDVEGQDMAAQALARRGDAPSGSCRLYLPDGREIVV